MISNIRDVTACPDCGSGNLVYSELREQVICRECGLLYEPLTPGDEKKLEQGIGLVESDLKSSPKKKHH